MAKKDKANVKEKNKKADKAEPKKQDAPALGGGENTAPGGAAGVADSTPPVKGKGKKGAAKKKKRQLTPEEIAQRQMEQAIRESADPSARLKKVKKPISWKSFFLAILFIIVFSIGIIYLWGYCSVDKFDFVDFSMDMFNKLGITDGFKWLGKQISGWFK